MKATFCPSANAAATGTTASPAISWAFGNEALVTCTAPLVWRQADWHLSPWHITHFNPVPKQATGICYKCFCGLFILQYKEKRPVNCSGSCKAETRLHMQVAFKTQSVAADSTDPSVHQWCLAMGRGLLLEGRPRHMAGGKGKAIQTFPNCAKQEATL